MSKDQESLLPPRLTRLQQAAMTMCQSRASTGQTMGTKRIVSMQALEAHGLVRRVERNGMIVDWELTEKGREWTE